MSSPLVGLKCPPSIGPVATTLAAVRVWKGQSKTPYLPEGLTVNTFMGLTDDATPEEVEKAEKLIGTASQVCVGVLV